MRTSLASGRSLGICNAWITPPHSSRNVLFAALLLLPCPWIAAEESASWPQFRGPNASGVAHDSKPPLKIGPASHVLWKKEVPRSPSSPCVWGDRIFLTTFAEGELRTCCYDRARGDLLWTRGIKPEKLEVYHRSEGSPAAPTPATDGTHVVSYFGSTGLVCYDFDGRELWRHPMAITRSAGDFGSGSSPIITGNLVILNRDQLIDAKLLALDVRTGKKVWVTPRPDGYGSFGTPIIWNNAGHHQVVIPGSVRLKGYDLKTGKERWMVDGLAAFACTTPVVGHKRLFFVAWSYGASDSPWPSWPEFRKQHDSNMDGEISMDEFKGQALDFYQGLDLDKDGRITGADWVKVKRRSAEGENMAIAVEPGGQGDITKTHVNWKFTKGLPYVSSPLLYDGRLYFVRDGGLLSCLDAETGEPHYSRKRIGGGGKYYTSPVAADGRIYLASTNGDLTVVKAGGKEPEILHRTAFEERIDATPALVGNRIYLRTESTLYAFE